MVINLVPMRKELPLKFFDCGNSSLNDYLKLYARKNDAMRIGKTYVALGDEGQIAGYLTLSNAQIERDRLPETIKLPRYPVPALRIGKLAVDKTMRGRGIGSWLLFKALEKAMETAELSAVYAVIVDAIDENAKNFYLKYGFLPLRDNGLSCFLPLETIAGEF